MIISVAGIRQFRRCQRQWAYDALLASAHAKDNSPRRELHLLSQIQSVAAWRGNLVDQTITRRIVPALEKGWTLQPGAIATFARSLFLEQLGFARQNRMREPGMTKDKAGDTFVALSSIEYGGALLDADVEQAWADVETAVNNLLQMKDLLATLRRAEKLMAQRPLMFPHFQVNFKAVPDLVAFYGDRPPLIVDWKVHARGTQDYRLQLAAYAIALFRCNPHSDFPASLSRWSPTDVELIEVQLLTRQQRDYRISEDDVAELDDYIGGAAVDMMLAMDGKSNGDIDAFDFPAAINPEQCRYCAFRRICTEDVKCHEPEQMTLL